MPAAADEISPPCTLCGEPGQLEYGDCSDLEYYIEYSGAFYRCRHCRFLFLHPLPARDVLPTLYPANYQNFEVPTNPVMRWLVGRFHARHAAVCRRLLPSGGAMLEVGAAAGDLLLRMQASGYERVQGIELSQDACRVAVDRGARVFHGTLDEFETDERFDLIFMSHVIEHVLDPVATVRRCYALLAPGGILHLETPNVGAPDARAFGEHWGLVHWPRHLMLFERRTLAKLVCDAGFEAPRFTHEINSCGWALSLQSALRRRGWDRSRKPRSLYYPLLLIAFLPLNLLDMLIGGTAFMAATARKPASDGATARELDA